MSKRLTIVLIVSDDTADEMKTWSNDNGDGRRVMFMGRETDLLELKVESVDQQVDWQDARFLPGSPEAAEYLNTAHWTDSQGNVHWRNR